MSAIALQATDKETTFIARLAKAFARDIEAYRLTKSATSATKEAANWDAPPHWLRRD